MRAKKEMPHEIQPLSDSMPSGFHGNERATTWKLPRQVLDFTHRPAIMGIVNVTPDSFSDGGEFLDVDRAVDHALGLVNDGADILDIGGESTRPGAAEVSARDELARVLPVIERLVARTSVPLSIDTSKAMVARAAIEAGARILNDVTGLEGDPEMLGVAQASDVGICAMHMRGNPRTMQLDPRYDDVVEATWTYLRQRREALDAVGIESERVCLDPGIGFGKTHAHTLEMLRHVDRYLALQRPILIGHSRKGFLAKLIGDPARDRTAATVGVALACAARGIQILRVHDVAPLRDALIAFDASGGRGGELAREVADECLGTEEKHR